jgi:hypothetical protein
MAVGEVQSTGVGLKKETGNNDNRGRIDGSFNEEGLLQTYGFR